MPQFIVKIPEVHYSSVQVEAGSLAEAVDLAAQGAGEEIGSEYAYTVDDTVAELSAAAAAGELPDHLAHLAVRVDG